MDKQQENMKWDSNRVKNLGTSVFILYLCPLLP